MSETSVHLYPVKILEHHLDAYGHVNNVSYISLFEEARWDLITAAGCGLEVVRKSGVGPVVLEIQTKFRKELRLRSEIVIKSWIESWQGKIGVICQEMLDQQGVLYCEAKFTLGLFDLNTRRLVGMNEAWSRALRVPKGV
jgi:thioesterase-3